MRTEQLLKPLRITLRSTLASAAVLLSTAESDCAWFLSSPQANGQAVSTYQGQARFEGFVEIEPGRSLYVDHIVAQPGRPTVVLLNGLTYRTGIWNEFVRQYIGNGHGILRYDPVGQGQTLLRDGAPTDKIVLDSQVRDLKLLIDAVGLTPDPTLSDRNNGLNLVGISYGGALGAAFSAQYASSNPGLVRNLVMIAPFTEPMASQDGLIRSKIHKHRLLYPWDTRSHDELYDEYLKQIVYSTYWQTEPIVLEYPTKLEATYRLAQGVRKYKYSDIASKLAGVPVHMVIALNDQYIPKDVIETAWEQTPASAQSSLLYIFGSEHKVVEFRPHASAVWVERIVEGDQRLIDGRKWKVGLYDNRYRSLDGTDVIVPRSLFGRDLLNRIGTEPETPIALSRQIAPLGGLSCRSAFSK